MLYATKKNLKMFLNKKNYNKIVVFMQINKLLSKLQNKNCTKRVVYFAKKKKP